MKKKLLILLIFISTKVVFGQMKKATFEDGTVTNYTVLDNTSDKIKSGLIKINIADPAIEYQYYKQKTFLFDVGFSLQRAGINFTYFLIKKEKEKMQKLMLKSIETGYHTFKNYIIKNNAVIISSNLGLHGGISYLMPNIINLYGGLSAIQLAGGIGYFKTKHMSWLIDGQTKAYSFTKRSGFYADALYFTGITISDKYKYKFQNGIPSTLSTTGAQLYFEGSRTYYTKGKNEFGYFWRAGWAFGLINGWSFAHGGWPIFGLGMAF